MAGEAAAFPTDGRRLGNELEEEEDVSARRSISPGRFARKRLQRPD